MLCFPYAKLNVGLYVQAKRPDGYHNIESLMYPFACYDALEALPAKRTSLQMSGLKCLDCSNPEDNLVWKAYALLLETYKLPKIAIHLHKCIPVGAGLGGGSSDAAHMLKLLNTRFELGLTHEKLAEYAIQLGSDVPFFLKKEVQCAKGRGEQLEKAPSFLEGTHVCVIVPEARVSTAKAYKSVTSSTTGASLMELIKAPHKTWDKYVRNDFQDWLFEQNPEVRTLADTLRAAGAWYVSLSGSGTAVYGLFSEPPEVPELPGKWSFTCTL